MATADEGSRRPPVIPVAMSPELWPTARRRRATSQLVRQINQKPVQPSSQKHFPSVVGQISDLNPPVSPERGAGRDRHERCGGMRWTRLCRLTSGADADGEAVWS